MLVKLLEEFTAPETEETLQQTAAGTGSAADVLAAANNQTSDEMQIVNVSDQQEKQTEFIPRRALYAVLSICMVVSATIAFVQTYKNPFNVTNLLALNENGKLRPSWKLGENSAGSKTDSYFTATNSDGTSSLLMIGTLPSNPEGTRTLLSKVLQDAALSGRFSNLTPNKVESWSKLCDRPGALACDFSYETPGKTPMSGLTCLIPDNERTEYYTLLTTSSHIEEQQWELAELVKTAK